MKNFYMAVTIQVDPLFTEYSGGYVADVVKFSSSDNLKIVLERIGGLKTATMCSTKKEAEAMKNLWNETFKKNGEYAFERKK